MTISPDPFYGGISPATSPEALAPGMAVASVNVRTGASLRPLNVADPTASLHNAQGAMTVRVPANEVVALGKPIAPFAASITKICQPLGNWLATTSSIKAHVFTGYETVMSGERKFIDDSPDPISLTGLTLEYTQTGFKIHAYLAGGTYLVSEHNGVPVTTYQVAGPKFQFSFLKDNTAASGQPVVCPYGGPAEAVTIPTDEQLGSSSPEIPPFSLQLYDYYGHPYAVLECVKVDAQGWDYTDTVTDFSSGSYPHRYDGGYVTFTFECNYVDGEVKEYLFKQKYEDAAGHDSIPSDPSAKVVVLPGERLTMTLPEADGFPTDGTHHLLRGGTGSGQFILVEDQITGTSWTDTGKAPVGDPLPPYGDFTAFGFTAAQRDTFLTGAVEHPDRYLAVPVKKIFTGETDYRIGLAVSDYQRYHVFPKEWFVPLGVPIVAADGAKWKLHPLALAVGQILAFLNYAEDFTDLAKITGKVFAMRGRPGAMRADMISDSHPLLNELGLFETGGLVGWPKHDGLAVYSGGKIEIVTAAQYGRSEWQALKPHLLKASVAGDLIMLEPATTGTGAATAKLLVDLSAPPERRVTTWTDLALGSSARETVWQSGIHRAVPPVYLDAVRIEGALGGLIGGVAGTGETATLTVTRYPGVTSLVEGVKTTAASASVTVVIDASNLGQPISLGGFGPCDAWDYKLTLAAKSGSSAYLLPPVFYERKILDVPPEGITLTRANVDDFGNKIYLKFPDKGRFSQLFFSGDGGGAVKFWFTKRDGTALFNETAAPSAVTALVKTDNTDQELVILQLTEADGTPLVQPIESVTLRVRQTETTDGLTIRLGGGGVLPPASSSFIIQGGGELACAQVVADAYITDYPSLDFTADGAELATPAGLPVVFGNRNYKALPLTMGRHVVWDTALAPSTTKILSATILVRRTVGVPAEDLHLQATEPEIRRWQYEEYDFGKDVEISGLLMDGPADSKISLFLDGNRGTADWTDTLLDGAEKEISGLTEPVPKPTGWSAPAVLKCRRLMLRFATVADPAVDDDLSVTSIRIFLRQVEDIGPEGWSVSRPIRKKGYLLRCPAGPNKWAGGQIAMASYSSAKIGLQPNPLSLTPGSNTDTTVSDGRYFTFARTILADSLWKVTLPDGLIDRVQLIPRRSEPWTDGALELVAQEGKPWPWLGAVFEGPPDGYQAISMEAQLKADLPYATPTPLTHHLYPNRTTTTTTTQKIPDAGEFRIGADSTSGTPPNEVTTTTPMALCQSIELDFGARNADVARVLIHAKRSIPIDKGGVIMRSADGVRGWLDLTLAGQDSVSFTVAQVMAEDYTDMALILTPESGEAVETPITGPGDFRLSHTLASARRWTMSLIHAGHVREVRLLGRKYETVNGRVVIPPESDLFSWLGLTVQSPIPELLQFYRIKAKVPVNMLATDTAATIRTYHGSTYTDAFATVAQVHPDTGSMGYLPRLKISRRGFDLLPEAGVEIESFTASTSNMGLK